MLPFFTTVNKFAGALGSMFLVLGMWYSNAFSTGFLPLNSNRVFDHFGHLYNVSRIIDRDGLFVAERYSSYSPAYVASGNLTNFIFFFAMYTATLTYAWLYHAREIKLGFVDLVHSFRKPGKDPKKYNDIHNRLMASYDEGQYLTYDIEVIASHVY
jgi:hypothetical protein